MATNEIVNFSVKSLNGAQEEKASLSLCVPEYYASKDLVDKTNYLVYRAFQTQLNNERQGTRSTKTRAEVRGGGRKPWQQKGSGRARAGSTRSPLWKGGGVSFGPKPKLYCNKINRKEWRLSLRLLLLKKHKNIIVVDQFEVPSLKTKDFIQSLSKLGRDPFTKTVIVVPKIDENLRRPSKNLKNIKLLQANCLNIKELLITKSIILTKESLKIIEETYKNG
jgi:large subunit ribosomal protein L4